MEIVLFILAWLVRELLPVFCRAAGWLRGLAPEHGFRVRRRSASVCPGQRKPEWVKREVLRLAALTGQGCRAIAQLFNRLHAAGRKTTVSKSFVAYTVRKHRYEIEVLRRQIRRRPPRSRTSLSTVNEGWPGVAARGRWKTEGERRKNC